MSDPFDIFEVDTKEAVRWLQRAHELGLTNYPFVSQNPLFANLRGDPTFQTFLESTQREWEVANQEEEQDPLIPSSREPAQYHSLLVLGKFSPDTGGI